MRLVSFGDYTVGVMRGDEVVDLSPAIGSAASLSWDDRIPTIVRNFKDLAGAITNHATTAAGTQASSVRLRASVPRPPKLLSAIGNYGDPLPADSPLDVDFTFKSPESVIGPGDTVVLADVPASGFEAEATLAVVIGREARKLDDGNALSYVFGYTAMLDVFAAGLGRPVGTFFGKSLDTQGPMGPCIVTADELGDPDHLDIRLVVNGETRQSFNTSQMLLSVAGVLRAATGIMTLFPGDVVTCGSPPDPKILLKDGDEVEVVIDGIGSLLVGVSDPSHRTWPVAAR
jgi:2-keto-4-pentenoate hydratase/2-oxohepta-3-ene-1,7-dioic acid hydratase in catechol pathway